MKYNIVTYGCQMNKNDSRRIAYLFEESGHGQASEKEADFIILNACSVRERVVDKIRGKLENLPNGKILILTGCVLKEDKEKLSQYFDYILDIKNLTEWHKEINHLKEVVKKNNYFQIGVKREKPIAHIPIMTGCDNFCSYCAVPYVRGREKSRPQEEIIQEVKSVISKGFKEIWLLGQNVNSYNKKKKPDFPDLLKKINSLPGDFWIRFTSSHPKDFSKKLIKAMKSSDKVTDYLNLPLQSGDDNILKEMNRPYTIKGYKKIITNIRKEIPEITLSTDIIVGFPGETKETFNNTKKVLREVGFDMAYIARYSPRPQTEASKMKNNISNKEKKRRARELTDILKEIALKKNKSLIGKTVEFLPLTHKKSYNIGKTKKYKTIKVKGGKLNSRFQKVKIIGADYFGLKGEIHD